MFFVLPVAVVIITIVKGTVGLVSTMPSLPVDASSLTAPPVALNGRGQTAQAKTATQTGHRASPQMAKSSHCSALMQFGTDSKVVKDSSSYAKHVSFKYSCTALVHKYKVNILSDISYAKTSS